MAAAMSGATLAAMTCGLSLGRSLRTPARLSAYGSESVRISSAIHCHAIPRLINEFVVQDATGRQPLVGRDGSDPAGYFRIATPGLLIIGYRSNPSAIEQTADKFNQYLKEEGLEGIAALRAQRNQTGAKARELFARCARSLLVSGPPSQGTGRSVRSASRSELVAERNPYALNAGQEMPVRLIYENRPLERCSPSSR